MVYAPLEMLFVQGFYTPPTGLPLACRYVADAASFRADAASVGHASATLSYPVAIANLSSSYRKLIQ
jgi:hypothetical protein